MIRILPFLFFFNISLIAISQNVELFYQPIIKDLKNDDWNNLRNNLDTLLTQHRNSLMVPFTLKAIGDRALDNENFEQLYIYSQLMLQYNADKFRTDLPSESKTKWDYYYIHTAKEGIYNWAHLYLATCYLHQQQYDSCLTHIDQAYIGNYISLPSSGYTYNVITSLHKNLIRSYCYEHKGETKKAIKVITTYLFLDDFEKIEHFYSHKDIIRQFIRLTKDKKKYEISNDTLIKKNILYVKERKNTLHKIKNY